ncbi:lysophospholipase, partial [Gaertneriomyces semiglobifer]
ISPEEEQWVSAKRTASIPAWRDYLMRANISGLNINDFTSGPRLPNIAISISGGGYRAMLGGASVLNAFDVRNETAAAAGTGGVLQIASYLGGLSGGAWLVSSLAIADFAPLTSMFGAWDLDTNLILPAGQGGLSAFRNVKEYNQAANAVDQKAGAGFKVTLTDYWSQLLGPHIDQNIADGAAFTPTWSSLAALSSLANHTFPFPLVVFAQRSPQEKRVTVMSNVWEANVFDTGSFNPAINAFVQTKYYGTFVSNDQPQHQPLQEGSPFQAIRPPCVNDFDHSSFIAGTSSSLFNVAMEQLGGTDSFLQPIASKLSEEGRDTAIIPNPFHQSQLSNSSVANDLNIELVDGGENGQNLPLFPLIQVARDVDVILAGDVSADTVNYYPNATSVIISAQYATWMNLPDRFPPVPMIPEAWVAQGLLERNTVFGCGALASNGGGNTSYAGPMLVYIPNRSAVTNTNYSTFKLTYSQDEIDGFYSNGMAITTHADPLYLNDGEMPQPWPTCLACILIGRPWRDAAAQQTSTTIPLPSQCKSCFQQYCWNGSMEGNT